LSYGGKEALSGLGISVLGEDDADPVHRVITGKPVRDVTH